MAGLAALALGLSACSGSGAVSGGSGGGGGGATAQPSASANPGGLEEPARKISWHSCPGEPAPARCARLAVPLDYAHPGGRTITLALNEIPATAPAGQVCQLSFPAGWTSPPGLAGADGCAVAPPPPPPEPPDTAPLPEQADSPRAIAARPASTAGTPGLRRRAAAAVRGRFMDT